ncbi:endonuclease/exonuclease/phosphatase family metal-dependent hydrolase [Flavobacterium araucananum]|jgi:endonuclease/exonuclease/phosphatase family metal-dependent hydrolase|uniref:Endonuclease/exonuclease/phosphatase n=1 Tax=Flavobacterium araucananum TaxID=946678 RepID=A0A227P874_9FLAO|nr:endonuclease/exonuclease/phosphatase family protein [Flavobacterium araucananum]OXG06089.1 endonuclease/exonuclease/phosphatase [Flavobacterium araucananum]PWJ92116.1 endonuclease/exonuclease/phosphatase family metal-dependent hydrolase [Flavobacterium araucananum]
MRRVKFLIVILLAMQINGQNLKIMTYNIRVDLAVDGDNDWSHRKDFFTSQIQFYQPDVFGIQEAAPNQVNDIASNLAQYSFVGIGREGVGKGESSTIFYNRERLKMLLNNTFWLSETPGEISLGWDAAYKRVCTYALFKDLKTKQLFWIFNTHLDHVGEQAKINGIKLILAKIKEVNNKNYSVIFTGDLNSEPESEGIFLLKKEMKDTREVSKTLPFGPSGTFNGFKHNEPVTRLLDYILISKDTGFKVEKFAVLSDSKDLKYPSDHLPVYVELSY